ncbi:MAG: hypothetical protein ACHQ9S_27715 [Candidatus Binatia bacterium]
MIRSVEAIRPGTFEPESHFYLQSLNAAIHPTVSDFFHLSLEQIIQRHLQTNPRVDGAVLRHVLTYQPRFLHWAGTDLFHVTNGEGVRDMMVLETNSSPSGQKSMPLLDEHDPQGSYRTLVEQVLAPCVKAHSFRAGALAVLYDKNYVEASGYAAALADCFHEPVYLIPYHADTPDPAAYFQDGILQLRTAEGRCQPIRAALRYVTQKPWTRIPLHTRTLIMNPLIACLAGGRNKSSAAKAYEACNERLLGSGLAINLPKTVRNVTKAEVPSIVREFGGYAVVKVPYTNCGQGVFTITNEVELQRFIQTQLNYDRVIVQALIGHRCWTSGGPAGGRYHVGTVPDASGRIYVADLRFMVGATQSGFKPLALFARRARLPLADKLSAGHTSWDMLGTNLSLKHGADEWSTDDGRLIPVDRKGFNRLGLSLDSLIQAYVQSVLASVAIDEMACSLQGTNETLCLKKLAALCEDEQLLREISQGQENTTRAVPSAA